MAQANKREYINNRAFPMSECPLISGEENADILLDYCNRTLAPQLAELFEKHMESCAACRNFAESQTAVWKALDAFEAMPISDDFNSKVMLRIAQEQKSSWWSRAWNVATGAGSAPWRPLIPVAAALLLAVGIWVRPSFTDRGVQENGTVVASHTASTQEVEQVESALEDVEMLRQLGVVDAPAPTPI